MTVRIAPMIMRFRQSTAADVVANRIYIEEDPSSYSLDLVAFATLQPPPDPDPDGFTRVDLGQLANDLGGDFDGTYDIYVTALDERGNESSPLEIQDAVFDFAPPEAPTEGAIEES